MNKLEANIPTLIIHSVERKNKIQRDYIYMYIMILLILTCKTILFIIYEVIYVVKQSLNEKAINRLQDSGYY